MIGDTISFLGESLVFPTCDLRILYLQLGISTVENEATQQGEINDGPSEDLIRESIESPWVPVNIETHQTMQSSANVLLHSCQAQPHSSTRQHRGLDSQPHRDEADDLPQPEIGMSVEGDKTTIAAQTRERSREKIVPSIGQVDSYIPKLKTLSCLPRLSFQYLIRNPDIDLGLPEI